jgi:hypothetical protein
MKSAVALALITIGVLLGLVEWSRQQRAALNRPVNFTKIHSHNDYHQPHPLLDALKAGARSFEADVNLVDDKLLVAHSLKETKPDLTLESMYLDPLQKLVESNHGSIYGDGKPIVLLVEEKTEADVTYPVLRKLLESYSDLLTHYRNGQADTGAITVIITGHEPPRALLSAEPDRFVACDGILADLNVTPSPPADLVPWISSRWSDSFTWKGTGTMPDDQHQKLLAYIEQAHAQHRTIRFWDAPDNPTTWAELQNDRVDWINTDQLADCAKFLSDHPLP